MARVTVEDCVEKIPNRFDLVMVSSKRAREIASGSALTVDRDNDKNTVVSLREIAEETVSVEDIKESMVRHYQRVMDVEAEEEPIDFMDGEEEWAAIARESAEFEAAMDGAMHESDEDEDDAIFDENDSDENFDDEE